MEIKGEIEDIIYQNEINSYTVCTIASGDDLITAVGYLPFVNVGETIKATGKFITHQEYGEQFKIETFEKMMPETIASLEKYLSSGVVKGVGPATARKIVDKFKDETLHVLKFDYQKLSYVTGISETKALEIGQEFNEKWEMWHIVEFLERFSIAPTNAKRVYDALGKDAIVKIEENPYILIDVAHGVNFKEVDKIALGLGIEINNDARIESGIKYALSLISVNGHTCAIKENLVEFVKNLLLIEEADIENSIINLIVKKQVIIEENWIYLYPFYKAEKNIAEKMKVLIESKNIFKINNIEKYIKKTDIELSEKQIEAIKRVAENNVCIITGGPGTGKTTIIKTIIDIFRENKKKIALCAPTGRAAKRMNDTTGEEAKTLHRLLEIAKIEEQDIFKNIDCEVTQINADLIVIDEVSMVDIFLMNHTLKAVRPGTKLILVGDTDQLASVGPGSVLKDLIMSDTVPTITLDKIFRQAAMSQIIVNAHKVNKGETIFGDLKKESDFIFIEDRNQLNILSQIIRISESTEFKDLQILTPTKKGILGTKELNKFIQKELNPESPDKQEKVYGQVVFREGDKVMQIRNNYDMMWEKLGGTENRYRGI